MAGFVFRLQSFLGVKEKIEEQKRAEYGKSMSKLNLEIKKLEDLENMLLNTLLALKEVLEKHINAFDVKNYTYYCDRLKNDIKKQQLTVEAARNEVEQKRAELVEAMKERKMLETLKEHDKEAYMKEQLKKEQKVTDEIVSYKYSMRST